MNSGEIVVRKIVVSRIGEKELLVVEQEGYTNGACSTTNLKYCVPMEHLMEEVRGWFMGEQG